LTGVMGPESSPRSDGRGELSASLEESLAPIRVASYPVGVLFSGGVDSSLLAWELRLRPSTVLLTMGRKGSADLTAGKAGAERIGLPWEGREVGETEVRAVALRFETELDGVPHLTRSVLVSLALAMEGATPSVLLCGQGADELFLGYAHYRGLGPLEAERRSREDLSRLHERDWPRTLEIARKVGKQLVAPYLSDRFESAALRIPINVRLPGDHPKRFFREWALERGVPPELVERPKKAVQYGSGVDPLVRRLRRRSA